jgi:hypothetical protein
MTDRLTCTICDQPIPNGEAVVRSRLFEQRHFHAACLRPMIPAQRTDAHDALTRENRPTAEAVGRQ